MHLSSKQGWVLRLPLQIESLRRKLPDSPQTEELLRQLQRFRENLDAVVYALSSRELAGDRRQHLLEMLERHRKAFEDCLVGMGIDIEGQRTDPLHHYKQLDQVARAHLAAILGVSEEPSYYEVLDIKAEEYLAQLHAFETITAADGFRERARVARHAKRGALALTLSGSMIQLSAPAGQGGRRYIYQNIYGNAHPPEGMLVLDRDIRVGHRIRSVELTTSPVKLLRVAGRRMSWKAQRHTFQRLARTFTSLASRAEGSSPEASPSMGFKARAAERVLHQEYAESFLRFEQLRRQFAHGDADEKGEAELLATCHFLQTVARELGFDGAGLSSLRELSCRAGQRYVVDAVRKTLIKLPSGGAPEVVYPLASIGRQQVTCAAPLMLLSAKDGGLLEVIGPVARIRRR